MLLQIIFSSTRLGRHAKCSSFNVFSNDDNDDNDDDNGCDCYVFSKYKDNDDFSDVSSSINMDLIHLNR